MYLLVDATSVADDPELPHLLSFSEVEGLTVEHHITFVERTGDASIAVVGREAARHISLAPFHQFREFAAEIAARPGCSLSAEVIERALVLSFLAQALGADAVVSPARSVFEPRDSGLLDIPALVTIPEALAVIGAYVRQREEVPLGGSPLLVQQRSEVYSLTARVIIPNGQEWWSWRVRIAGPQQLNSLQLAGAVFKRLGQALRGRDGVHEALRIGQGRAAVLEALYHFDVVLMSSVGSLDALARVAHEHYGVTLDARSAGWQSEKWTSKLPSNIASIVTPTSQMGAALRILTRTRNSIHSIPLDEYLHVERRTERSRVEHRVMLSTDLAGELRKVALPLAPLDQYGLFLRGPALPSLNIGEFTENLLSWTIQIVGELFRVMLGAGQGGGGKSIEIDELEQLEQEYTAALARVGSYPVRRGATGLPASPSLHQSVMQTLRTERS